MKRLHYQNTIKEMSSFYLSLIYVSLNIFTAHIITDNSCLSDLHVKEHGNIHQHALKKWLYFRKKSCQSCLHCLHETNTVCDWLNFKTQTTVIGQGI